ncbi:MAG: response regulator [Calditrichia bacterium]
MINIAIVEDHPDIRESLQTYLDAQENFICKMAFGSMEALLSALEESLPPQVLLLDIGLPGMSGLQGARLIKQKFPLIDIIMITVHNDHRRIFDALCAGASGYLLKDTPLSEIKAAIELLFKGGSPMSPHIARQVFTFFNQRPEMSQFLGKKEDKTALTEREQDILRALVDGKSYKLIAAHLGISVDTVRTHIKNIYRKLQVHNKVDAVAKYIRGDI